MIRNVYKENIRKKGMVVYNLTGESDGSWLNCYSSNIHCLGNLEVFLSGISPRINLFHTKFPGHL